MSHAITYDNVQSIQQASDLLPPGPNDHRDALYFRDFVSLVRRSIQDGKDADIGTNELFSFTAENTGNPAYDEMDIRRARFLSRVGALAITKPEVEELHLGDQAENIRIRSLVSFGAHVLLEKASYDKVSNVVQSYVYAIYPSCVLQAARKKDLSLIGS